MMRCIVIVCLLCATALAQPAGPAPLAPPAQPARAQPLDVIIIDAAHSETGEAFERWLAALPDTKVTRVDIPQLRKLPGIERGVVVWLMPESALVDREISAHWDAVLHNDGVGLIVVGLGDNADAMFMLDVLRPRVDVTATQRLGTHLAKAKWIWGGAKNDLPAPAPAPARRVRLQRKFELDAVPSRAWMEIASDNQAAVTINGVKIGVNENWRKPSAFDVQHAVRVGENVIQIDAKNDDGPAGVIASLQGRNADGTEAFAIVTDAAWPDAHVLANFGGGPWGAMVDVNHRADEYVLKPDGKHPISAGLADTLGRAVVLRGLVPRAGGAGAAGATPLLKADEMPVAVLGAGRAIVIAADPQKTSETASVLKSEDFAKFMRRCVLSLADRPLKAAEGLAVAPPADEAPKPTLDRSKFFPVTMQLSPIPYEGARLARALPDSLPALRRMIDNLIDHGVTVLQCPLSLPDELARQVEQYAQQRGMGITFYIEHGLEGFGRDKPPEVSLYSQAYREALAKRVESRLQALERHPNAVNMFITFDEPFHMGIKSFGYSDEEKAEFSKRFGRELPREPMRVRDDPREWLDLINFRSDYFPVGWRELYKLAKARHPKIEQAFNHDSHNTFGGAVDQEGELFVDDVFHWGSDFADIYAFDIYPYLMKDFRYGPNRTLMRPRMSQMHYAMAHMRNLTTSGNKKLGFYFGTYHPEWFDLSPDGRKAYWQSREMIYTAVAGGADVLVAGLNVPVEAKHWEDLGDALRTLQKASPAMLRTKPRAAKAAMLFPRTQCIQTQEEYFNVGMSFEMFQRAFGELDLIHEEQLARDGVGERKILVLFDIKLLPAEVMQRIAEFVDAGGIVIADCVPNQDELRRPSDAMAKLFGVRDAKTDRILWPVMVDPAALPVEAKPSDRMKDMPLVSVRPCEIDGAEVVDKTDAGAAGVMRRDVGKGLVHLLGFCLQDTAFEAFRTGDLKTIAGLTDLLASFTRDVKPSVKSSNPEIEAGLRVGEGEAFVVLVAHEPQKPAARVMVGPVGFEVAKVVDMASGQDVPFARVRDGIELQQDLPLGATRLLHLTK